MSETTDLGPQGTCNDCGLRLCTCEWRRCRCACHQRSVMQNGLVHDMICCERMNGSLAMSGIPDHVKEKVEVAVTDERKRILDGLTQFKDYEKGVENLINNIQPHD